MGCCNNSILRPLKCSGTDASSKASFAFLNYHFAKITMLVKPTQTSQMQRHRCQFKSFFCFLKLPLRKDHYAGKADNLIVSSPDISSMFLISKESKKTCKDSVVQRSFFKHRRHVSTAGICSYLHKNYAVISFLRICYTPLVSFLGSFLV